MKTLALHPQGKIWTDEELMALDFKGRKHELWFGKIVVMSYAGGEHGRVIARLLAALVNHTDEHRLGQVFDGQTGCRLRLDLAFAPDVSFVSKERLKRILPDKEKPLQGVPDLVVEVLSPSDSITKTEEKLALYLTHGARLAWLVAPKQRWVRVYREPDKFELLSPGRFLTGNSVLPGFRYAVSRLFAS